MKSEFAGEITHYQLGAVDLYLHDWAEGARLYKSAGTTTSVAEAAAHDGPAIYEGHFREFIEDGTVVEQHPHAGFCGAWTPEGTLDSEATLLREVAHRGE